MHAFERLKQQLFYRFFQEISQIPRGSGNESAISDYVLEFARRKGLTAARDQSLNVIIKKNASRECTSRSPVILQCHLDMVCEKEVDSSHDFESDPIILLEDEGFLTASGTTLGADNGIGIAYILAVLDDDTLCHPPIEAIFTTNEEVGMEGMAGLDATTLLGTQMINLDNEEEGDLAASCAGGTRYYMQLPVTRQQPDTDTTPFVITVNGLEGGHSGVDIDKGLGSSIILIARLIEKLRQDHAIHISQLNGGTKANSIPRDAHAIVWLKPNDINSILEKIKVFHNLLRNEYGKNEANLSITISPSDLPTELVLSSASLEAVLSVILLVPNGVISLSPYLSGVVEASSSLGIIDLQDDTMYFTGLARSNSDSKMDDILSRIRCLARQLHARFEPGNSYPAWEYKKDSLLRSACMDVYHEMYGKDMTISSLHGGLECALMLTKRKDMDMVSIGPDLYDVHTTRERADIDSMIRTWDYLTHILQHMAFCHLAVD